MKTVALKSLILDYRRWSAFDLLHPIVVRSTIKHPKSSLDVVIPSQWTYGWVWFLYSSIYSEKWNISLKNINSYVQLKSFYKSDWRQNIRCILKYSIFFRQSDAFSRNLCLENRWCDQFTSNLWITYFMFLDFQPTSHGKKSNDIIECLRIKMRNRKIYLIYY